MADRITKIYADQIEDHSLTPTEMYDNGASPINNDFQCYDTADKYKWIRLWGAGANGSASEDAESTTTSTSFQNKATLSFTPLVTGTYLLFWSCEATNANGGQRCYVRVRQDDTTDVAGEGGANPETANVYQFHSGMVALSLTASTAYHWDMDFRASGNTAKIRRARFHIMRIA